MSETHKANGEEYTPRSLYLILAGLQRHLHQVRPSEDLNIFQDASFKPLKNVCDSLFKRLHSKGIGTETKATPVISANEEDKLWESGVINMDTPQGLLRGFFYNGKHFCLRGGQEQRNLRLSQFSRVTTVVDGKSLGCYIYREFGSKNHQSGFNSLNVKNKVVKQYENTANPERCHVKLLDKYFEVLPKEAQDNDAFYLTSLSKKPSDTLKPWYSKTPVGRNRLNTMLKEMCREAEISGKFTNHSLRAYGASTMFQANVPERLIQQRTGHRSLEALRQYERTSESQLVDVSNVMSYSGESSVTNQKGVKVWSENERCKGSKDFKNENTPTLVLSGCTFTGCSISFAGNNSKTVNQSEPNDSVDDLLKGIDVGQIFDDFD